MIHATILTALAVLALAPGVAVAEGEPTSRVPLVGDDTQDATVRDFYAQVRKNFGEPLNLHRTMANSPPMLKAATVMAWAIRKEAKVPRPYRELAIIRAVQQNGGHYEEVQHRPMALATGLSRAQVDAIADWRHSKVFDDRQRAVLGWTDGIFEAKGPSDAAFQTMKKYFSDEEIVELTMTATSYAGTAMFTRALHTPLEPGAGSESNKYGTK